MKFCHECGKKILDPSSSFCGGCGTNLKSLAEVRPKAPAQVRPTFTPFTPTQDEDDDLRVDRASSLADLGINLDKLDVKINLPQYRNETVAGLMSSGPVDGEPTKIKLSKAEKRKMDKANMEAFKNEGSAIKPQTKERKNTD